jgi:hypothetical protein
MSRKHYEQVAACFKRNTEHGDAATLNAVANDLASMFKADNPRFDRARFLNACGLS